MKKQFLIAACLIYCLFTSLTSFGQFTPELFHYKFNNQGTSVPNLASAPPSGTKIATVKGNMSLDSTGTCGGGKALIGGTIASGSNYLDTKWSIDLPYSWTISVWVKGLTDTTTNRHIFGANTFIRCSYGTIAGKNNLILTTRDSFPQLTIKGVTFSKANVVTYVMDSAAAKFYAYLNGVVADSVTITPGIIKHFSLLKVGGAGSVWGLQKGALLDEFRIYNRALSPLEVASLSYSSSSFSSISRSVCYSYTGPSGRRTWTKSGTYKDTISNSTGCDSIITVNLTIKGSTTSQINPMICNPFSYTSPSGKYSWRKSGIYYDTISNSAGCDSFITINLTILARSQSFINVANCYTYTSPSGKYTWTTSGIYKDTIPNNAGCDSIITITLSVKQDKFSTISPSECYSYTSPSGKYTWTTSGTYIDTIPSFFGCDSTITINLTINNSTFSTINPSECYSYTSPSGKYTWTTSSSYEDTLTNSSGCDSIITINLSIDTVDIRVVQVSSQLTASATAATYQWLNCDNNFASIANANSKAFTATTNGDYAVEVTQNSCVDTSVCVSVTTVGVRDIDAESYLYIYPNPTSGEITIRTLNKLQNPIKNAMLRVISVTGQTVFSKSNINGNDITVDLTELSTGIYFIELEEDGNVKRTKFNKR